MLVDVVTSDRIELAFAVTDDAHARPESTIAGQGRDRLGAEMNGDVLLGVYPPNLTQESLKALHGLLMEQNERARRFCLWLDGIVVHEMQRRIRVDHGQYVEARLPEINLDTWADEEIGAGLVAAVVLAEAIDDQGMADFLHRLVFLFSIEARGRLGG
jgi:hypothetical protein